MAMPTSDEELASKQERVLKLREQVAAEEAKRLDREASVSNDITAAQLDAEVANLEAQLTSAKAANKGSAKASSSAPLEAAKEQMKQAVARKDAAESASEVAASSKSNGGSN